MRVNIQGTNVLLKYTFNSFKHMEDFDLSDIEMIENKPFKMIGITETLMLGAVNNDPKVEFTQVQVSEFLESYIEENDITELLGKLMDLLEKSSFFKSLQMEKK